MSNNPIYVEDDLFHTVGVRAEINTTLYSQLLAELSANAEQSTQPITHLFPALSWMRGYAHVDRTMRRNIYSRTSEGGNYDPDHKLISIACTPDTLETNKTLLHEATHWGQDIHGDLQANQRWLNASLAIASLGFAGGIAGIATGIYTKNADLSGISALSAIVSPLGLGWYKTVGSKVERQAYRRQEDPVMLATYGRIITYHALT